MQTSVNLQPNFSYYFVILFILIFAIVIIYFILKKITKPVANEELKIIEVKKESLESIKQRYLSCIDELVKKIKNKEIDLRAGYQELSKIIRNFVSEVTGIEVQNYTLKEIKKLKMPLLYELIKEYYAPEFSENSFGDIELSINKTRKVIEKWN